MAYQLAVTIKWYENGLLERGEQKQGYTLSEQTNESTHLGYLKHDNGMLNGFNHRLDHNRHNLIMTIK